MKMPMLMRLFPAIAAAAVLSGCATFGVVAVRGVILASPVVVLRDEPHLIVLPPQGYYRALQLEVTGAPVIVYRVVIQYANGEREVRNVNWAFRGGRAVQDLRLAGDRRRVRDITVYTRPEGTQVARATIRVRGLS